MNKYKATDRLGVKEFTVTDEGRVLLRCDDGSDVDVTLFTLLGAGSMTGEEALVDLYTDADGTEGVSIEKVEN